MDPEGAAFAMREYIKPKQAIAMHYGTFPVINRTPAEFKAALGNSPIKVIEAKPGEPIRFYSPGDAGLREAGCEALRVLRLGERVPVRDPADRQGSWPPKSPARSLLLIDSASRCASSRLPLRP